jgi:hypothetical protein
VTARELEAMLTDAYGPDFRDIVIVGLMGSFRLADSFDECGLRDPQAPEPDLSRGLWQCAPSRYPSRNPSWTTFRWPSD